MVRSICLGIGIACLFVLTACTQAPGQGNLPDLPAGQWTQVAGGAGTSCADGSAYSFFVYPGNVNKLVVDFQGGGACWNDATCAAPTTPDASGYYVSGVFGSPLDYYQNAAGEPVGIYDKSNPDNPVKDWYHVHVNYCTGDIHWGDAATQYTNPVTSGLYTVQHKGQSNVRDALAWIEKNFVAPEDVLVTGCSAGAYGSVMYAPDIITMFPGANLSQLGDAGAGITASTFLADMQANWSVEGAFPAYVPGLDPSQTDIYQPNFTTTLYSAIAAYYPASVFAQHNSYADGTQIGFYQLGGGMDDWTTAMLGSQASIDAASDNYTYVVSDFDQNNDPLDGTGHCLIIESDFYTETAGATSFSAWLADLVDGGTVPAAIDETPVMP